MYLQLVESGGRGQGGVHPPWGSQSGRGSPFVSKLVKSLSEKSRSGVDTPARDLLPVKAECLDPHILTLT